MLGISAGREPTSVCQRAVKTACTVLGVCAPGWIVDLIREGYVIPFYSEPTAHARPNQQSARGNAGFVDLAVAELLSGGYIESVSAKPYICSPLSVVETPRGSRGWCSISVM